MFCGDESNTILKPKEEAFVKFLRRFYEDPRAVQKPVAFIQADGSADKVRPRKISVLTGISNSSFILFYFSAVSR